MYRITKQLRFCYGHRLLNHDGKCRHLHGHNATAEITLEADALDVQGMVRDFSEVGRVVGDWIEQQIDHTMLLHPDDPMVPVLRAQGERVHVMQRNPTAENIARLLYDTTSAAGFPVVEVTVWETDTASASYRADG